MLRSFFSVRRYCMSHYYSPTQEDVSSCPQEFNFHFRNESFKFHTDAGVFSKNYIDYGSFALLSAFESNNLSDTILDMGAGYGTLGIVLARLYQKKVHFCEINERACKLIHQNIEENKIVGAQVYQSNLYETLPEGTLYSTIVTNPPIRAGKNVVFDIYKGAFSHLIKGGELWVVIQKKQGAPSSKAYLEALFGNCSIIDRNKGYYILKCQKLV